ncbi:MAG: hypothetical protein ISS36_00485 [Candidatus Aenigmarchaeota archaeon]|nr:hypothetical protein [Candidatus Aenigmarchaeota archaeon]
MKKQSETIIFLIVLFIYIAFALISLRGVLGPGTLGHNWDWLIPVRESYLIHLTENSFYMWDSPALGFPVYMRSNFLAFTIIGGFGYIGLTGDFVSKLMLFVVMLTAGMSMFFLTREILKKRYGKYLFPSFIAGFFYAFSPLLFNEFIGGANTQFISYSILPLTLFFHIRFLAGKHRNVYLFLTASSMAMMAMSLHGLAFSMLLILLYSLKEKGFSGIKEIVSVYAVVFFFNIYWILPTIFSYLNVGSSFIGEMGTANLNSIQVNVPSIYEALIGIGYFKDFFKLSIDSQIYAPWLLVSLVIPFMIFLTFLLKRDKEIIFWGGLFLISAIFATGGKEPFGALVVWMYQNISLMNFFRSPQHIINFLSFCLAVSMGISLSVWMKRLRKIEFKNFYIFYVIIFIIIIFWLHPFFAGDFSISKLESGGGGSHLDNYRLSPGYNKVAETIEADKTDSRVLFLPMSGSPYFLKNEYQLDGQGSDPFIFASPKPPLFADIVISSNSGKFLRLLEKNICDLGNYTKINKILAILNVKYIILRKDVVPNFGYCRDKWNLIKVEDSLKTVGAWKPLEEYVYIDLYENQDYLEHIYITNDFSIMENIDELFLDLENETIDKKIFFMKNQLERHEERVISELPLGNSTPKIFTEKINPTKYRVVVKNATGPYFLVFSETYDNKWGLYDDRIAQWLLMLFQKPRDMHFIGNGYANVWYIDKLGNYEMTIYFWPQSILLLGLTLNIIAIIIFIFYSMLHFFPNSKTKKP